MNGDRSSRRGSGEGEVDKTVSSSARYISDKWVERDIGIFGFEGLDQQSLAILTLMVLSTIFPLLFPSHSMIPSLEAGTSQRRTA